MGSKTSSALPKRESQTSSLKYPEVLRFRLSPLDSHPLFGSSPELEGEIPFLGPTARLHGYLNYLKANPDIIQSLAHDILSKYREAWPNESDDDILLHVRNRLPANLLMAGPFKEDEAGVVMRTALVGVMLISSVLDSIVDSADAKDAVQQINLVEMDYVGHLAAWAVAARPPIHTMPNGTAEFERLKRIAGRCLCELETALQQQPPNNADRFFLEVRDAFISFHSAHIIAMVIGCGQINRTTGVTDCPPFSSSTMNEIWRWQSGMKTATSMLPRLKNIWLSEQVQNDELFKIVVNRISDIGVVQNAILGLTNDARESNVDSPITWAVVHQGLTIAQAFEEEMRRIHGLYSDYSLASEKLIELYGSRDGQVKEWVEQMNWSLDAMLLHYVIFDRYANDDKKVVASNSNYQPS